MSFLKLLILGFVAGFLATLIFHQSAWYMLVQAGIIPADRPAWPMDAIPPFGLPSLISKAFWGGLWGAVLALFLARRGCVLLAVMDHRRRHRPHARRHLRGAAREGPAHRRPLAADRHRRNGQRSLGSRHRGLPSLARQPPQLGDRSHLRQIRLAALSSAIRGSVCIPPLRMRERRDVGCNLNGMRTASLGTLEGRRVQIQANGKDRDRCRAATADPRARDLRG